MEKLTVTYQVDKFTNDYEKTKRYLISCDANDSFPEKIDRLYNNSLICYTDGYILEVEFDDKCNKIIYHQIYDRNSIELIKVDSQNSQEIYNNINDEAYSYYYEVLRAVYKSI